MKTGGTPEYLHSPRRLTQGHVTVSNVSDVIAGSETLGGR